MKSNITTLDTARQQLKTASKLLATAVSIGEARTKEVIATREELYRLRERVAEAVIQLTRGKPWEARAILEEALRAAPAQQSVKPVVSPTKVD